MTKENFLTKSWNNWLTIGLGIPAMVFAYVVLTTSAMSDFTGFIGMVLIGATYWTVVELHSAKRFVWLRQNSDDTIPVKLKFAHPLNLLFIAYNVIYWLPMILPFTKIIEYRTGFVAMFVVVIIRAIANLYRNNLLTLEQAEVYPFRIPWESIPKNKLTENLAPHFCGAFYLWSNIPKIDIVDTLSWIHSCWKNCLTTREWLCSGALPRQRREKNIKLIIN